jgi:adenosylhomocysteine nucleosidase
MKLTLQIPLALCLSVALSSACLAQTPPHTVLNANQTGGCITECTPRFGIVSAFGAEADILLAATAHPNQYVINGNTFTTGDLAGNHVVIVLTGISLENAAMTTQLMIDHFNIHQLLLSGIAGGVDAANHIGDVIIPATWAFPLEVYWNGDSNVPSPCGTSGDLSCLGLQLSTFTGTAGSDYHVPSKHGPVGTGLFMRNTFVRTSANFPNGEFLFDYAVDPAMFQVAQGINPALARCGPRNPSLCVSTQPVIRRGGRGLSAGAFLANPDYRAYVSSTLQGQSFDMETTAFAHVAYANHVPFIAFRSLSDLAGGTDFNDVGAFFGSGLAEGNSSAVTLAFLTAWAAQHQ